MKMKVTCCPCCGSNFATWSAKSHNKQPLVLKCGHTFCESCVGQTIKKISASHIHHAQATCPTCKTVTFMENGIKDLPVNVYLSAYIEINQRGKFEQQLGHGLGQFVPARKQRPDSEQQNKCKMCVTKNATCKCIECDSILCTNCFDKVHSISTAVKQHKPLQLSHPSADLEEEPKCTEHNRILEYFCEDDSTTICSRCYIVGKHQNHTITSIEEKNKEVLEDIENELPKARLVLQNLNRVDRKIAAAVPNVKAETKSLIESISHSFLQLHSLLQAREVEIINSVYSVYKDKLLSVDQQKEALVKVKSDLEDAVKKSDKLFENSGLLLDGHALLETLRKARTTPCVVVRAEVSDTSSLEWHETNRDSLTDMINIYGSITGTPPVKLDFRTIEEAPECADDDDKASVNSLGSETSVHSQGGALLVTGYASSIDNGEDVVIENDDVDAEFEIAKSSQNIVVESKSKQNREPEPCKPNTGYERWHITLPVVKGPPQKAVVTHIRSPNDFYAQLVCNKRHIQNLERSINSWCRRSDTVKKIPQNVEKGMLLLARYTADKQWYRARVIGVEKPLDKAEDENNKVHVEYIDFGNDEILPVKEVRTMQKQFMKHPAFSLHCSLFDIAPHKEDQPWSVESIQEFHQMTQNQILLLTALNMQGHIFEVDLCCIPIADVLDDNYVSVRDILIFLELARFRVFSSAAVSASAPHSYPKVDFIKPTTVKNGRMENVIVTQVTSPWDFHLVCTGEEHEYYLSMHDDMQEQYGKDACNMYSLFYPRVGMVCAAKGSDGEWHRAKVSSSPLHNQVTVSFVDLGIAETVSYDQLKKLLSAYIKLPIQAIHCQLMDVSPAAGPDCEWSDNAKVWCQDVMMGASGCARFVRCDPDTQVVLWLENSDAVPATHSINYTLVEKGFAQSTGPSSLGVTEQHRTSPGVAAAKSSSYDRRKDYSNDATNLPTLTENLSSSSVSQNRNPRSASDSTKSRQSSKNTPEIQKKSSCRAGKGERVKSAEEKRKINEEICKALCPDSVPSAQSSETMYIEVVVCNYISPSEFYVQVLETQEDLTKLMKDMQNIYAASEPSPTRTWSVNEYCAAKYSADGLWYRGSIMAVMSDEEYQVELVDFGNTNLVKSFDLRPLQPELGNRIPCAAARCFLANLVPAGSMITTKWSQTAVEFMASLLKDRKLYIKQEGDPTENGLPVDLIMEEEIPETAFEPRSQTYHSMRSAVLDRGLALSKKDQSSSSPPDSPGIKPFQRFILTEEMSEGFAQCPAEGAGKEYDKNSSSHLSPNKLPVLAVTEDEEQSYDVDSEKMKARLEQVTIVSLPAYPLPEPGLEITVVPTYVDAHGLIYAQPLDWEGKCVHQSSELQRIYGQMSPGADKDWKQGQMCVALFPEDGLFYRAQVQEIAGSRVRVQYIDFGNSAWVKKSCLHELLPEFAKEHVLAYSCVLHELEPNTPTKSWPQEVLSHIHDQIVNYSCTVVVIETDEVSPIKVQLFRDDMNLSEHLIENNMAACLSNMKRLSEQSSLIGQVLASQNPYRQLDIGAVGDTFRAIMVHIELPNLVYLQHGFEVEPVGSDFVRASEVAEINNNISEFIDMAERLKSCKCLPMAQLPDVGLMCAALFSADDQLYRALCVQRFLETDSCLVVYVDYGTSEVLPRSSLRVLPSEFWSFPAQAIRCYINLPFSPGSDEYMSQESMVGVIRSLAKQELTARILKKDPLTVELMVQDGGVWRVPYKRQTEDSKEKSPTSEEAFVGSEIDECVDVVNVALQDLNMGGKCKENWNDESDDENVMTGEEEGIKMTCTGDPGNVDRRVTVGNKVSKPYVTISLQSEKFIDGRVEAVCSRKYKDDSYNDVD